MGTYTNLHNGQLILQIRKEYAGGRPRIYFMELDRSRPASVEGSAYGSLRYFGTGKMVVVTQKDREIEVEGGMRWQRSTVVK